MPSKIKNITKGARRHTKAIKQHLKSIKKDAQSVIEILDRLNLELENQLTVEEVFKYVEPFLTQEGTEEFNKSRDNYLQAKKHLRDCWELQATKKAEMEDAIADMRRGNVTDENLDIHYSTSRDLHVLLGAELNYLNLAATTGIVLLDQIKKNWGKDIVADRNQTLQ